MWNNVILDIDGNETINFGPRFECADPRNLYEVHTLATVTSKSKVETVPNVLTSFQGNFLVLAVDKCISIFTDEFKSLFMSLQHESNIECLALSADGVLFVGERNGVLHSLYLPKKQHISKYKLFAPCEDGRSFASVQLFAYKGKTMVAALSSSGKIVMSELDLVNINAAADQNDWNSVTNFLKGKQQLLDLQKILPGKNVGHLVTFSSTDQTEKLACFRENEPVLAVGVGPQEPDMYLYMFPDPGSSIKKVEMSSDCSFLFILDNQHQLHVISSVTFLLLVSWCEEQVLDFTTAGTSGVESDATICTLVLLVAYEEKKACELQLRFFPSFELHYSVQLSRNTWIIRNPHLALEDSVLVLEGEAKNKDEDSETVLRLRCVAKADMETKFAKLLRKGKFSEAEEFANLYNLDIQEVYKAQVFKILNDLNQWKENPSEETDIQTLIKHMKTVKDINYVLQCCLQASLPSSSNTKELLFFAKDQVLKSNLPDKMEWIEKIEYCLQRLHTFLLLFPEKNIWSKWFEFSSASFQKVFLNLLHMSCIDKAFMFWKMHQGELSIGTDFCASDMETIFSYFPENILSCQLIPFLKDVLPRVLVLSSKNIDILAVWLMERCQLLEITEMGKWPGNGLKLLQTLPEACEWVTNLCEKGAVPLSVELNINFLQGKFSLPNTKFYELLTLMNDLILIQELREDYQCVISLATFRKESKESIIFLLLDHLAGAGSDVLEKAVKSFLKKYTMQHNLDMNYVFSQYIEDILCAFQVGWRGTWEKETPWEQRALAILNHITDPCHRVLAILKVVSSCPLPWSQAISEIVKKQLQGNHEMNSELEYQMKLSSYKVLLLKYSLQAAKDSEIFQPRFVLSFIKYIFKQAKTSALEDGLQVARTFDFVTDVDIHYGYLISLLNTLQEDKFFSAFKELIPDISVVIGERILNYTILMLNCVHKSTLKQQQQQIRALIKSTLSVCNYLKAKFQYLEENIQCLEITDCFQSEFFFFVRPCQVETAEMRWKVYDDYLNLVLGKETEVQTILLDEKKELSYNIDLLRIADILGLPSEEAQGRLVFALLELGKSDQALEICSELDNAVVVLNSESLYSLVVYFFRNLNSLSGWHVAVFNVLTKLCSTLVLTCSTDKLEQSIDLSWWSKLFSRLAGLDPKRSSNEIFNLSDPYQFWHFSVLHREQGLRLCLDDFVLALSSAVFSGNRSDKTYFDLCNKVILQLNSHGHHSVCLNFLLLLGDCASISELNQTQVPEEVGICHRKMTTELSTLLVTQIGSQRRKDFMFALGLVCLQKRDSVQAFFLNLVKANKSDNNRLNYISKIGISYGQLWSQPLLLDKCKNLFLTTSWMSRLAKLQITVKDAHMLSPEAAETILSDLYPVAGLDLIVDFCNDYNMSKSQAILSCLEALFNGPLVKKWGQEFTQPSEAHLMELNATLSKADACVGFLKNCSDLRRTLFLLLHEVNPYCYEVIEWLLKQISLLEPEDAEITQSVEPFEVDVHMHGLQFLKTYKRLSRSCGQEIDTWAYGSNEQQVPEISSSRLPYYLLTECSDKEKEDIIGQEVYASTIKLWLSVAPSFHLDTDLLLVTAAQNELQAWLNHLRKADPQKQLVQTTGTSNLSCDHLNSSLLQTLKYLVHQIQNMDVAISCAFWIVKRIPDGPNKVNAAESSVKLASAWVTKAPRNGKAQDILKKIRDIYCKTAVEQELVKFSLVDPENMRLAENPSNLILHLLEHPESSGYSLTQEKDLFMAVKEISKIGEIDLAAIYHQLLESWMLPSDSGLVEDEDTTFTINLCNPSPSLLSSYSNSSVTENLKRSVTLLRKIRHEDLFMEEVNSLLMSMTNTNNMGRAQIMRCLSTVLDNQTLCSIIGSVDPELLWEEIQNTSYLARLESLNLAFNSFMFAQCNKSDLIISILQSHSQDPKALTLCSSLCFEYAVWKLEIWNIILGKMSQLKMMDVLEGVLWQLDTVPSLWNSTVFVHAWECLLKSRIQDVAAGEDTMNNMVELYLRIFSCPCLQQINLTALADEYESREQPLLSLCCLLCYRTMNDVHQSSIKSFLQRHAVQELKMHLNIILNSLPVHRKIAFTKVTQFIKNLEE